MNRNDIMNKYAKSFVDYIISDAAPRGNKAIVTEFIKEKYGLIKDRTVYYCNFFAVRFSYTKNSSFSNTVLSLSHLQKYDRIPFFVVLVRRNDLNKVYIANTTFLSKISHSSKLLAVDNIRGSFNGSDIIKQYADIDNVPNNFDKLFAIHEGLDWNDNLLRLVDASADIKPRVQKFIPTNAELNNILNSINRAQAFVESSNFKILKNDLESRCEACKEGIWVASHIENVNTRGRIIESMITSNVLERNEIIKSLKNIQTLLPVYDTKNDLGDYNRVFDNGDTYTDIKTKIVYLDSAPKAYNVDKFLDKMAKDNSSFFFFFVGIDEKGVCSTKLCSVYHKELLKASIMQHHWAGRSTRGVVQFDGKVVNEILCDTGFVNCIDKKLSVEFLRLLLDR